MKNLVAPEQAEQEHRPGQVKSEDPAWQLRKYLLLLATLVATVTYVAGLDPPGGVWPQGTKRHPAGNPILPVTRHVQYTLFYYFNATAFAASLMVSILLLFMKTDDRLPAVRGVIVLDVLCLMVAYVAGSSRGLLTTIYSSLVCAAVLSFVILFTKMSKSSSEEVSGHGDSETSDGNPKIKEQRKVLMLLATFVTPITYTAALNPPGGFWEKTEHQHRAGDPILLDAKPARFLVFLFCNTAAFAASLVIITLLLSRRLWKHRGRMNILYGAITVALLSIMVSYTAGSSRNKKATLHVLCLVALVVAYIVVAALIDILGQCRIWRCTCPEITSSSSSAEDQRQQDRSQILLLATLAATVTYQAGLSPPGGAWSVTGHTGGGLILPETHPIQYPVFFYWNSAAFVTSIIVIMMVQSKELVSQHALKAAVILDLFGLIGAYLAGSYREALISLYVLALAFIVFVGMVILVVVQNFSSSAPPASMDHENEKVMEKRRKLLLMIGILAVTITYQTGLSPPGNFWEENGQGGHAGDPVLTDNSPGRYKTFFYCNATSFMLSVAVIVVLVGRKVSAACLWPIRVAIAASLIGLIGLLGSFVAGTTRRTMSSIYISGLVCAVLTVALIQIHIVHKKIEEWFGYCRRFATTASASSSTSDEDEETRKKDETYSMRKYLMLVGILAASVTYQAGLVPPGGVWPRDGEQHSAGDRTLHDGDSDRYNAFFYSNSACFVASIVVIVLLLQGTLPKSRLPTPMKATHMAVVVDLLGLLVAYATGSTRDWYITGYVLVMAASVLVYVVIYLVLSHGSRKESNPTRTTRIQGETGDREIVPARSDRPFSSLDV